MAMRFLLQTCVLAVVFVLSDSGRPAAQEPGAAPANTASLAAACAREEWREIEPGLDVLQAAGGNGAAITALRIDQNRFRLAMAIQSEAAGERVDTLGRDAGAIAAINGGFFGEAENGDTLFSVGLLRVDGRQLSRPWRRAGGFLALEANGIRLSPTRAGPPEAVPDVLQSKPMLIEPGGRWAMNTNRPLRRWRSLVCIGKDGELLLAAITGLGLSLYEAGWLMRGRAAGGYFGCTAALALDGGGSTQLWVAGRGDLSIRGETPVHNALVVTRRQN